MGISSRLRLVGRDSNPSVHPSILLAPCDVGRRSIFVEASRTTDGEDWYLLPAIALSDLGSHRDSVHGEQGVYALLGDSSQTLERPDSESSQRHRAVYLGALPQFPSRHSPPPTLDSTYPVFPPVPPTEF
ncbi:uncharacterized protein FIBRA_08030 [Fibroporia radiculosa]|uniref:Uncharacterized protein n=1 Tax=Fibroporia radiculosa TaxID=599839 RepID=J4IC50_9APHY|nr:uncharacterized protein FIBRA_08030 [Fibroporia radiculosa]CCM05796.1 predicted protein [Fibroporia radiculosa]